MTAYFAIHCGMTLSIYHFFGKGGLLFHLFYTISGLFWAETVNYLEHYGLRRRVISDVKTEDGKEVYESIDGFHSWNAPASTLAFKI